MNTLSKSLLALLFAAFVLFGCDGAEDSLVNSRLNDNPVPDISFDADPGSADFSLTVNIGNSLTAGFMDGALYDLGQQNSIGVLLNRQLQAVGAQEQFNQPDINSANGFNSGASNPGAGVILGRFKLDPTIPGPSPLSEGELIGPFEGDRSALHNFGVPGIQVGQLLTPNTGTPDAPGFNPFYARFASNPGTSTILGDVIAAQPTFFTLWIGNNDVLGYALSGATNPAVFTSVADFQERFGATVNTLMANTNAKGLVTDIPSILAIPLFRAVPYNAVELDQDTADQLNAAFAALNEFYALIAANPLVPFTEADRDQRSVSFQAGANPVLVQDPDLEDLTPILDLLESIDQISPEQRAAIQPYVQARQLTVNEQTGPELLLLSAATVLGTLADPNNPLSQIGVVVPLSAQFHLTAANIVEIETRRQTFNAIMEQTVGAANQTAGETRLAFYNTNAAGSSFVNLWGLDGSQPGIEIGPQRLMPDFSPAGVFSTDGVHPNSRGNALVVNDMIAVIEDAFGASIPRLSNTDILNLPSVQICAGDCVSDANAGRAADFNPSRLFMIQD
ncbi:GDSL-like Lipase/Acylhydrolase [Cyclonatronum proteinivorum]|uniref:GDSL-like Lipase/Acylhydrolase n=1 Tax=Cyclonatronum proteinivorum TaxID=1457365 RepID=A0A345UG07_9BACT|nr:hypothetical protein [Cyclonatronum proteinivorum]AXI99408.1 GDSL-like Lipase/Acylhydrolase [Cyclonatronum proteinivorum]